MDLLRAVAADKRIQTMLALIVLDIVMGIAAALHTGTFRWAEVGRFYSSTVAPFFIGYVALRLLVPYIAIDVLGPADGWIGDALVTLFWTAGAAALIASIAASVKCLGISLPFRRDPPIVAPKAPEEGDFPGDEDLA